MRAARIAAPGGPEALRIESIGLPRPGPGEVLVRVHYASINPVDWKLRSGRLAEWMPREQARNAIGGRHQQALGVEIDGRDLVVDEPRVGGARRESRHTGFGSDPTPGGSIRNR